MNKVNTIQVSMFFKIYVNYCDTVEHLNVNDLCKCNICYGPY